MGFFDTILGMFGIGQPKLTATASQTSLSRGALVTVDIKMEGGNREIPITALMLALKSEKKLSDGQTSWDTLTEEKVFLGKQLIRSGEVVTASLTLQVPTDCTPTGSELTYKLEASADVPGWDPEEEIKVTISADSDPMAAEDHSKYHVLPEESSFRNSSVRGDFRVYPLADGGAVMGWKSSLICRNADGSERWRCGYGRTATVSPDGATVAAANQNKQIGLIDVTTGEVGEVLDIGDWVNNIAWVSDGLACNVTEKIIVVSLTGEVVREITSLGSDKDPYIGSMSSDGDTLFVIDSNERLLVELSATTGEVSGKKTLSFYPSDVYRVAGKIVLDSNDTIVVSETVSVGQGFDVPGREGVRFLGQSEHSSTHFKPNARLSPSGEQILLNDQSGMLWLLTSGGKPVRTWPRATLNFIEDTGWIDDTTFVAITNDGRSHKISAESGTVSWSQQDA
jgi:hypothetical protein